MFLLKLVLRLARLQRNTLSEEFTFVLCMCKLRLLPVFKLAYHGTNYQLP